MINQLTRLYDVQPDNAVMFGSKTETHENRVMASTIVFVTSPALTRENFDAVIELARSMELLQHDSTISPAASNGRLVGKTLVSHRPAQSLRQLVKELLEETLARLDIDPSQLCIAVLEDTLTEAEQFLLVMDVDSTLIKQEVIELLAAHAGREKEVAEVTEAAMRGELDFAQSLIARVATLKGLPVSVLQEVGDRIVFSDGAENLVRRFHAAGHKVGVVSGGFQQILDPMADRLSLDHALANTLGIEDGLLTGTVHGDIVDRAAKEAMLRSWAAEHGIAMSATIAAGDGANDLDMVTAAALGVAFNAKPALRAEADVEINFSHLDVIGDLILNDLN